MTILYGSFVLPFFFPFLIFFFLSFCIWTSFKHKHKVANKTVRLMPSVWWWWIVVCLWHTNRCMNFWYTYYDTTTQSVCKMEVNKHLFSTQTHASYVIPFKKSTIVWVFCAEPTILLIFSSFLFFFVPFILLNLWINLEM